MKNVIYGRRKKIFWMNNKEKKTLRETKENNEGVKDIISEENEIQR